MMEDQRGEIAQIDLSSTRVTARVSRTIVGVFLLLIVLVPVVEVVVAVRSDDGLPAAMAAVAPAVRSVYGGAREAGARPATAVFVANREVLRVLHEVEQAAESETVLARLARGPTQYALSRWLGAGTERAYVGRDGWLFYRPDLDYLTGPGFLTERRLAARAGEGRAWEVPPQPDPRIAILHFKQQLDARGIALVVMAVPGKSAIEPGRLSSRYTDGAGPLDNPSFGSFAADLERAGVIVFDAAREVVAARVSGHPAFLQSDTHWRPEIVEAVAIRLAAFLHERVGIAGGAGAAAYSTESAEVSNIGDIAAMFDPPAGWRLTPPERVRVRRVLGAGGAPWRPSRDADVLLLGDSFTNVYSLDSLGWGSSAGLAEQLSFAIGRPIDRLTQNDQGAFVTRDLLARQLAGRGDRLSSTRVVVWQFAARELMFGDWRIVEMGRSR